MGLGLWEYERGMISQTSPIRYPNGDHCYHCKWILDGELRRRKPYCVIYNEEEDVGGVVYQSTDKFCYALHITKTFHDTSDDVMVMMQLSRKLVTHLVALGIRNARISMNSKYDKRKRSRDHQHAWVVCDVTAEDRETFDRVFGTVNGKEDHRQRKIVPKEPYPTDIVVKHPHNNFAKLKNPLSFLKEYTSSTDFYIFADSKDGKISGYTVSCAK